LLGFCQRFCTYYTNSGENILPNIGGIYITWYSNLQFENGSIPKEVTEFLDKNPILVRNNKNLGDQFSYKYKCSACHKNAVFLASFRSSFYVFGSIKTDINAFNQNIRGKVISPYDWKIMQA